MKISKKVVTLHLTYFDDNDLNKVLIEISNTLKARRTNNQSGKVCTADYIWTLRYTGYEDYTEKQIDGVWYKIYQSKMNKK